MSRKTTDPKRIPPGQTVTEKFPVLHVGSIPTFDEKTWDFRVTGLVENPIRLTWSEFLQLPKVTIISDFHCVTTWSRFDNVWEGVSFRYLADLVKPKPEARYVVTDDGRGYTANLPLEVLMDEDVLFAYKHDGQPLAPEHGGPLRLVVPKRYAWKSTKWVRGVRFLQEDEPGYWEVRGYSNTADPWTEDRFSQGW
ncbi:MAG TPA: sulfite oxidase-like oxidoreductase [Candidatus Limnocylindrales bacterium]|nr:sulfite oxidase-like oxidoreductase [Candidatus Limnocylindrales bacterium]